MFDQNDWNSASDMTSKEGEEAVMCSRKNTRSFMKPWMTTTDLCDVKFWSPARTGEAAIRQGSSVPGHADDWGMQEHETSEPLSLVLAVYTEATA